MKTKSFLAMSLMAALAVGCSSDDIVKPDGGQGELDTNSQSYIGLSISLPSISGNNPKHAKGTRSENDKFDQGTADEYKVNTLTVRYLDANGIERKSFTYSADNLIWSTPPEGVGITTKAVLPVETVPFSGTAYALVEINNPFGSSIAANGTCLIEAKNLTGEDKKSFFMTNTVWKDGHYLVRVTTSPTKNGAQALASQHTIYVERAAAKVQVGVANWPKDTYTIPESATNGGAMITVKNWVLDVTNKKMFPIRKFRGNIAYNDGGLPEADFPRFYSWSNPGYRTYWAEDPNYSEYVAADFNVITEYPATPNALNGVEYCAENTFDVRNQCQNQTTRALIKANYIPKGFKSNQTWYTLGNSSTPLNDKELATLILKAAKAAGTAGKAALVADKLIAGTNDFTKEMFTIDDSEPSDVILAAVKKDLGQITVYKNGECYYVVRIKHFGNEMCPWGDEENAPAITGIPYDEYAKNYDSNRINFDKAYLGRYGVVRNNWYKITINTVSQPGSPVVPKLSTEQDDEHYNYLQSTVEILDWAVRTQEVNL